MGDAGTSSFTRPLGGRPLPPALRSPTLRLRHGHPWAGHLLNGLPPPPLSRHGRVRRDRGPYDFNVRLSPDGRVRRHLQICRLLLPQVGWGGSILPNIPFVHGSRGPVLQHFRLRGRRSSELITTQRVRCIWKVRQSNMEIKAEQLRKAQNTYGPGRPLQAMCLRAPFVADRPLHHAGDPV